MHFNIVKIGNPVQLWPSNKPEHKHCIIKDSKTGESFEGDIPIKEIELYLQLKNHFPENIPSGLQKAIEDYGQYMYDKGSFDTIPH